MSNPEGFANCQAVFRLAIMKSLATKRRTASPFFVVARSASRGHQWGRTPWATSPAFNRRFTGGWEARERGCSDYGLRQPMGQTMTPSSFRR